MGMPGDVQRTEEFEGLLRPVLEQAWGTAFRLTGNAGDAEDLLQEAALLAHRGFGSFTPGTNFRAWFFRILLNRFYSDHRRNRKAPAAQSLEDTPEFYLSRQAQAHGLGGGADAAERLLGRIDTGLIERAMTDLPEEFRTVAVLYFMQDLSYQEIADMLDVPIGTVRSRLHRARRLLQRNLWRLAEEHGLVTGASPVEERSG